MKKILFVALNVVLVFAVFRNCPLPNLLLILGSMGLGTFFVRYVLLPWWRARQAKDENRPSSPFYGYVSLIWLLGLLAASGLFVIISHKDDPPPPLQGHTNEVQVAVLSPAADRLATAGADPTIRIWNVAENSPERELRYKGAQAYATYLESFTSVAISPDDSLLAIGSTDQTVRIWDNRNNKLVGQLVGHTGAIRALAFSPDGAWLASAGADQTVRVWRVSDWSLVKILDGAKEQVTSIAFNSESKYLASGSADHSIRVYQLGDWTLYKTFTELPDSISAVAFVSNTSWVLAVSERRVLGRWDLQGKEKPEVYRDISAPVSSAAFSNDGNFLATGDADHAIRIWSTNTHLKVADLPGHSDDVTALDFDGAGARLVSGSKDATVRIWDAKKGTNIRTQDAGTSVVSVVLNNDGGAADYLMEDRTVRTLPVKDGNPVDIPLGMADEIVQLAFNKDGSTLVSASRNGVLQNWKMNEGGKLSYDLAWQSSNVTSLAINPTDSTKVAGGNQAGVVRLWSPPSNIQDFTPFSGMPVSSLAFNSNGDVLAVGGIDQPILVRKTDGSLTRSLPLQGRKITHLVFSPNGKVLASASLNGTVVLYPLVDSVPLTGTIPITLPMQSTTVTALMFSGDSQTLFTGRSDGSVSIWNVADGALINTRYGNTEPIRSLGINKDGNVIAASSQNLGAEVRVMPVENLASVQNRVGYWLGQLLSGTELAQIFWAVLLGFVISALVVLVPIWGYSGIAARMLLPQYPGLTFLEARNWVRSVQLGTNNMKQSISDGKLRTVRPAVKGIPARFGGPGLLVIEEGNAAVLAQGGKISRIVGYGTTVLKRFETVSLPVYLGTMHKRFEVEQVVTKDKIVLDRIELFMDYRVDPGDRSRNSGTYRYDNKVIMKIWTRKGCESKDSAREDKSIDSQMNSETNNPILGGNGTRESDKTTDSTIDDQSVDWDKPISELMHSAVRDVIARHDLQDLVVLGGVPRTSLNEEIRVQIGVTAKQFIGVELEAIAVAIDRVSIPQAAMKKMRERWLTKMDVEITQFVAEITKTKLQSQGEGQAQALATVEKVKNQFRTDMIAQLSDLLTQGAAPPIANATVAVRFLQMIEELTKAIVRDDVGAVRYLETLEKFATADGDKSIYLGAEGWATVPDGSKTEKN